MSHAPSPRATSMGGGSARIWVYGYQTRPGNRTLLSVLIVADALKCTPGRVSRVVALAAQLLGALLQEHRAVRAYARRQNLSVNQLTRELLRDRVLGDRAAAARELLRVIRSHQGDLRGWKWNRADAYDH